MLSKKTRKDLNSVFLVTGLTFLALLIFDKFFNVHNSTLVPEDNNYKIELKRPSSIATLNQDEIVRPAELKLQSVPESLTQNPTTEAQLESIAQFHEEPGHAGLFGSDIVCPAFVHKKYSSPDETSTFEKDLAWCKERVKRDNVQLGKSWGRMNKEQQMKWDKVKCNEIIARGKLQTCDERWGWASFDDWLKNSKTIIEGASSVKCAANVKTSTFCQVCQIVIMHYIIHYMSSAAC